MNERLLATVQQRNDESSVRLAGILDEDNNLGELVGKVSAGRVVINLAGLERINSCGTRDWVNWLGRLEAKGIQPVLVACSTAIVAQLNLVRNFAGHGVVQSFYVPYHCPNCDEEKQLLVDVADMGEAPHEPPLCRCDDCESLMTFDDLAESYFGFVPQAQKVLARAPSSPDLARGSMSRVKTKVKSRSRISQPPSAAARQSRPSLSVFQTPANGHPAVPTLADRPSQRPSQLLSQRPSQRPSQNTSAAPGTSSPYVMAMIAVLVCTIGVLGFMLAT